MVYIGSDHAGFEMKESVKKLFQSFIDVGTFSNASCDYPVYAKLVCMEVLKSSGNFGILICGTGTGMSIAANKYQSIRAANCIDANMAALARSHNDANVLVLGARLISVESAHLIISTFINTKFSSEERHVRRLSMIH